MKAFFLHSLSLLIYGVLIFYILGEHKTTVIDRFFIVLFFLLTQPIVYNICDTYNLYPKPKNKEND